METSRTIPAAAWPDADPEWVLMDEALRLAREAAGRGEVPVGAVLALGGEILGRGFNRPIGASDPTAHAEIVAIRQAAERSGNYRLTGAVLVTTLEPCLMCLGAMIHARVGRLVFGARDPRLGATSLVSGAQEISGALNHRFEVSAGVREAECANVLREFFRERRSPAASTVCGEVPKWS